MKVISKGAGWSMEAKCTGRGNGGGGCGATLELEEEDIKMFARSDIKDGYDYYMKFVCVECQVKNTLRDTDVPRRIIDKLRGAFNH
jgi:hypothetical protein